MFNSQDQKHKSGRNRLCGARGFLGAVLAALAALTMSASTNMAAAQEAYPASGKYIRIIAPFPGFYENVARALGESFSEQTGQNTLVEVKPGADGQIAARYIIAEPADGYTVFLSGSGPNAANAAMYKNLGYDPVADFSPVSGVTIGGLLIAVPGGSPFNSIADLIAAAKADPTRLKFAGTGASGQAAIESLKSLESINIRHIPYKSPPQGIIDLISGRVDVMAVTLGDGLPLAKDKKIKILATTASVRSQLAPDIPTMQEAGVKDYEITFWFGVWVRTGTPEPVIAKLNEMVNTAVGSPRMTTYLQNAGMRTFATTPEELGEFQKKEIVKWRKIVEAAGMQREQ